VSQSKENIYSRDQNLLHLSHEGGVLEDPWTPPPANLCQLTRSVESAPGEPEVVEIGFERGTPVSVDGERLSPVVLLEKLNEMGGRHGVGRVDLVENRLVGMKSRGVYETPGGTILYEAHEALESITLDRATSHFKSHVALRYSELTYDGLWFTPLREAMDSFVEKTQETVEGEVLVQLYKGSAVAVGRRSKYSLYSEQFATFGEDEVYRQSDAEGFIRLFGLPLKIRRLAEKARKNPKTKVGSEVS
jgi:argininosuccinate synthase